MTLRLLWLSDKMIGGYSAYSKITYECCTRLTKLGHDVAHIPMGRANRMGKSTFQGVLIYPSGDDPRGEDVAVSHYVDWKADMLITLKEPWNFRTIHREAVNFTPYAIIDHSPVSPSITSRLHTAFKVIVPSKFAQNELKRNDIDSVYLPHGIRTDIYRPLEGHKADCKKMWYLDPDDFTVLIIAMNRCRKQIPRMLRGYKRFLDLNPDVKSHMLLWTDLEPLRIETFEGAIGLGVSDVGIHLMPEIIELGLGEDIIWPEKRLVRQGIPEWTGNDYVGGWDMVKLYNAADAVFLCSGGEAAGLPYIEGAACGVTPIGTDYAGAPEYIGPGFKVKWDDYVILNTPGTRYALASIDGMAEALTKVMNANSMKLMSRMRRHAENYGWDKIVVEYFKPFLEECETELKPLITQKGVKAWT